MNLKYRADIDGLRTIAVLSVLLFHLNGSYLSGGFVGVDIFFVISGYLITKIIVNEVQTKTFSFARFYERRIRRIFPALFFMLLICAVFAYLTLPRSSYRSFFVDFKYAAAQISNFRFAREVDYMGIDIGASPLLHTWSLAVEEQFYLIWPLFIFAVLTLLPGKWLKNAMLAVMVLSLTCCIFLLQNGDPNNAFYMFYARAYELAIGALVALLITRWKLPQWTNEVLSVTGLLMVVIATTQFSKQTTFPGYAALLPSIGTAFLIFSGSQRQGFVQKALSIRPMVYIGLISYSLYLWHWPIITFYKIFMQKNLDVPESITIAIASFVMAYMSFRFIEVPFRRPGQIAYVKFYAASFALIGIFIIAAHQMKINEHRIWGRQYTQDRTNQIYFKHMNRFHKLCLFDKNQKTSVNTECAIKGNPEQKRIDAILVGDSHAIHYAPAVEKWAMDNQKNVYIAAQSSCPIFLNSEYHIEIKGKNEPCTHAQSFLNRYIIENNIKHIIYAHKQTSFLHHKTQTITTEQEKTTPKAYQSLWANEILVNRRLGRRSSFLTQIPEYTTDPKKCYQSYASVPLGFLKPGTVLDCRKKTTPINTKLLDQANHKIATISSDKKTFKVFHLPENVLPQATDKGEFYYVDKHHMNHFGALRIAPYVSKFLND